MDCPILVIVLGDIGHSPRMTQHIQELLASGHSVDCIAYHESPLPLSLQKAKGLTLHSLSVPFSLQSKSRRGILLLVLASIYKIFYQVFCLFWLIFFKLSHRPKIILNQNPPCLPLFFILPFICWYYQAKWIIDWHNLAYSIMALSYGSNHPLVRLAKWCEYKFGSMASYHVCVTEAMKQDLIARSFNKDSIFVCYDHPNSIFKPCSFEQSQELFSRLPGLRKLAGPDLKTALVISSTSWTVDEKFDILLDSIDLIEKSLSQSKVLESFPQVLVFITGKGPLKKAFMQKYALKNWTKFSIVSEWLDMVDYAQLLASGDLGLSFHQSSSGLDFPMKIIDMLGCKLPVVALNFPCAKELIQPNINGRLFSDAQALSELFRELLDGFPQNQSLSKLKTACQKCSFWKDTWSEHWRDRLGKLFTRSC